MLRCLPFHSQSYFISVLASLQKVHIQVIEGKRELIHFQYPASPLTGFLKLMHVVLSCFTCGAAFCFPLQYQDLL